MVGLARTIYTPRPDDLAGELRNPAELCDAALADRTAVESLLFDAFIPAAYRSDSADHWKVQDAERWFEFLARHLETRSAAQTLPGGNCRRPSRATHKCPCSWSQT
jgi:hypothetical protein